MVLVAATACGGGGDVDPSAAPDLPQSLPPSTTTPSSGGEARGAEVPPGPAAAPAPVPAGVALAARVLRLGADAIDEDTADQDTAGDRAAVLSAKSLRLFLEYPVIDSAVRFSCSLSQHDDEWDLVAALESGADEDAVLALAALIRVRAPRHIEEQWRALARLGLRRRDDPGWTDTLAELRRPFTPEAIDEALRAVPPTERHGTAPAIEWSARAAGVTQHAGAIARLVELSRGDHLDVSLAAGRSLQDFPGPEGDRALVQCILGWRYDAWIRAANALFARSPALLERTLLDADVPTGARRDVGLQLAKLHNPAAVPHLCATVGKTGIVDGKMFDAIEELATDAQWPLVEALPDAVRSEQRERAARAVAAVRARLGR